MATTLRLMTMNVGSGSGEGYVDFTVQAHARFINQVNPDVVFLQEVDRRTRRAGGVDQLQVLSDSTALKSNYFAKARDLEGGEYGDGIISRYPLENVQNRTVYTPSPGPWWDWLFKREAVSVAYAEISLAGTRLRLYNTHFSLTPERRKFGADALAAAIPPNVPIVLGGDFNGGPGDAEFTAIDRKFVSAEFIAGRVDMDLKYGEDRIDQIYVSGGIACGAWTAVSAEEQPRGRFSDHAIVYADLLVPNGDISAARSLLLGNAE